MYIVFKCFSSDALFFQKKAYFSFSDFSNVVSFRDPRGSHFWRAAAATCCSFLQW